MKEAPYRKYTLSKIIHLLEKIQSNYHICVCVCVCVYTYTHTYKIIANIFEHFKVSDIVKSILHVIVRAAVQGVAKSQT